MASPGGRENSALIERLFSQPYRFDFFQAVRVLERAGLDAALNGDSPTRQPGQPVGHDARPSGEAVRFRAATALGFPSCAIVDARQPATGNPGLADAAPPEMTVAFMGLTGPSGVLPLHYTRMLIERIREKDYSLRDFFDLFNHRMISLFYRAWEKYRFPAGYQRSHLPKRAAHSQPPTSEDFVTFCLLCLTGLGTRGLRNRMKVEDESIVYYGGYFADAHRPAVSLERMVSDYFGLPAQIEQFRGQWLNLALEDRSRMPDTANPRGLNHQLGVTAVLGDRVWDVQSRFRVRLGPLTYVQYMQFTPAGDGLEPICQLIRTFVGPEFDFDIQPVLLGSQIPDTRIGSVMDVKPRVGWNVWLKSRPYEPDFEAAAFG
jgi:type VI secretion system protein ImpH